ncbi:MAG: hypothetical protein OES47_09580 [Acidobacteriota bacterium]|nr:hypothetical protein [Acidobacteriota bacterium]
MTLRYPAGSRSLHWSVTAGAILLALFAAAEYLSRQRVQHCLETLMTAGGASERSPEATSDVRNEPDSARAELRAARLLIADELDQTWRAELSPRERQENREQRGERLAAIQEIAARNLESQAASWQAAMILGAARYLNAARAGRAAGSAERSAWQAPLALAERLGPGKPEPTRFLAAAALSDWSRLGVAGREQAIEVLRRAFEDRETLELLLEAWMRRAPSEAVAVETVPDRVQTWVLLERFYSRNKDWERFASTRKRRVEALQRELRRRVIEAEERLAGGDKQGGRSLLLTVLNEAPPDKRHAATLERVMDLLPAGSVGDWRRRRLRAWLDWTRERCLLEGCPLSAPAIRRMAGAAALESAQEHAAAAMMAGDVDRAEALADRSTSTLLPEWGPYLLLTTQHFARTGDLSRARAALQRVHRNWHSTAFYRAAARSVAESSPRIEPTLSLQTPTQWSADEWRRKADVHRLEIEARPTCEGLRVEVSSSAGGSAVEVRWNGESVGWFAVEAVTRFNLDRPGGPVVDVLELHTLGGGRVVPGRVDLHRCAA